MFCIKCGNSIPENVNFCPVCGQPVKPQNPESNGTDYFSPAGPSAWTPPYVPPVAQEGQPNDTGDIHTGMKVWCILGIISGVLAGIVGFIVGMMLSMDDPEILETDLGLLIISMLISFVLVAGYALLLAKKKFGFVMLCVCAGINLVIGLILRDYGEVFFSMISPFITWAVLQKSWSKLK
jgi:hypothetical protein